jgi:hypothetical protein
VVAALLSLPAQIARADEGGVSFWIPGFYGSLAATPTQPGWSGTTIYYHDSVSAGGDVARAREFELRNIPVNFTGNVSATVNASVNVDLFAATRRFATSFVSVDRPFTE